MDNKVDQKAHTAKNILQIGRDKITQIFPIIINFIRSDNDETQLSNIRQELLKKVRTEVEDLISKLLHHQGHIILDIDKNPSQIESLSEIEVKIGSQPKFRLQNTEIITIFDQADVGGRLLILGDPGTGKTTMLLKLAEELVKRATDDSRHPIPVLFSLSFWKNDNQSIKDWLIDQLEDKYNVQKNIGKQLVDNQQIIPLLDGLDELAGFRQEKCITEINKFLPIKSWSNPVVVCSRIQEYQSYKHLLKLNNCIELCPLNSQQIYKFLEKTNNLQLWNSINNDADLIQLAKIPFFLNVIVISAQELSVQKWQQLNYSKERKKYLFDTYINRMIKRPHKGRQPDKKTINRWLGWLAQKLIEDNTTEFSIEKIQPDLLENQKQSCWLKNKLLKIIYHLCTWGFISTLLSCLIGGLIYELIDGYKLAEGISYGFKIGLIAGIIYSFSLGLNIWFLRLPADLVYGITCAWIALLDNNKINDINVLTNIFIHILVGAKVGYLFNNVLIKSYQIEPFKVVKFSFKNSFSSIKHSYFSLFFFDWIYIVGLYKLMVGIFVNPSWMIFNIIIGVIYWLVYYRMKYLNDIMGYLGSICLVAIIRGAIEAIIYQPIYIIIFILIHGIINAIESGFFRTETRKNIPFYQGIWQSGINTTFLIVANSFLFAIFTLIIQRFFNLTLTIKEILSTSLVLGVLLGLIIAIGVSGTFIIKHFVLRFLLYINGYIPWKYNDFLDYATERLFLQRVGNSYRFIHALLRQHFAKLYELMD